jgi:hypothetical protein
VISYYTAKDSKDIVIRGHQKSTREWWEKCLKLFDPFVSVAVIDEIGRGDSTAAAKRINAIKGFTLVEISPEVLDLAREYFVNLDLPEKARIDSIHLAAAVLNGMDYLVSWNFSHIVGARPRSVIERINFLKGIESPVICTPEELMED